MASFRKHKNGWEYRIRFKDPYTQEFKEKSKRGFPTKKEAQIAAAKEEKRIEEGYELSNSPSLENFLHEWLTEYKKNTVRKNTFRLHEQNIRKHIIPYFKKIELTQIKPLMYQKFLNHLIAANYSKRTVEIIHGTMYNALEKACYLGKLEKNPCKGATISKINPSKQENLKYMRSEDIPLFLQTAYSYNYIYFIFFKALIETGMRKGEAAALQWSDINWEDSSITITKSLDFSAKNEEELFGDTKTYNSQRIIRMNQSLKEGLENQIFWQNRNKEMMGDKYKHNLDLIFSRNDGNFLPKSTLFNAFSRILKKAGLPPLNIHSLRHTHAVLLLESGASMKFVQDRLGHGSITVTSDVYSHISKKINHESIQNFDDYYSSIF
ncbi:site-specific integrase [Paenibacillus alvei]